MKEYTFQAALSQCKVNGINFVSEYGDKMLYDEDMEQVVIKVVVSDTLVYLEVDWYVLED